jgi:polo-like kinase 1
VSAAKVIAKTSLTKSRAK